MIPCKLLSSGISAFGACSSYGNPRPRYEVDALKCAQAIIDIGNSVSHEWQRWIDQIQTSGGAHIGMTLGELNVLPMRPFNRAHMGMIGECVNLAARLNNVAGSGEIVISNALYNALPETNRLGFIGLEPVEAKNTGRIRAWKLAPRGA
jgi:adenylate cyclase